MDLQVDVLQPGPGGAAESASAPPACSVPGQCQEHEILGPQKSKLMQKRTSSLVSLAWVWPWSSVFLSVKWGTRTTSPDAEAS